MDEDRGRPSRPRKGAPANRSRLLIGVAWRGAVAIAVTTASSWIAVRELRAMDSAALITTLRSMPASAVAASVAFTLASYACLAVQEGFGLAMFHRRPPFWRIGINALIANALAGVLGFGLATGGALRLRLYRFVGLSPVRIAELGLVLSLATYFGGMATMGLSVIAGPRAAAASVGWALAPTVLAAAVLVVPAILWMSPVRPAQRTLTASGRLAALAASLGDWMFSGAALFCVSGQGLAHFPTYLAAFCLGSLIGSLAGVPAGLGVLEAAMLTLASRAQLRETAAALIVYRAIYFAGPAACAAVALLLLQAAELRRLRPGRG